MKKKFLLLFMLSWLLINQFVMAVAADPTVDGLWTVTLNPHSDTYSSDYVSDVAVDSTGIYSVGPYVASGTSNYAWRIEKRSLTDGSIIWEQTSDPSAGSDIPYGVAVYSDAVYVVGRYDTAAGGWYMAWRIEKRSLTDGSIIWCRTRDHDGRTDEAQSVAVDSTGIYVVGYNRSDTDTSHHMWLVEKLNHAGVSQWNRSRNPSLYDADAANPDDQAFDVVVAGSDVYVLGSTYNTTNTWTGWILEKMTSTGVSQWNLTRQKTSGSYWLEPEGLHTDGSSVYVIAEDYFAWVADQDTRWKIEKLSSTGVSQWNVTSNPTSKVDAPYDIVCNNGFLYPVGIDQQLGNRQWRVEKRVATDGSLVWNHTINPSGGWDTPNSVAVDDTAIYVGGSDNSPGGYDWQWRIEKMKKWATLDTLATSTGSGIANFNLTQGDLVDLLAVDEATLPTDGKPALVFPHGFFSFNITGLANGAVVDINITYPAPIPPGTEFWKYGPTPSDPTNHWYQLPPAQVLDNDGDNTLIIRIQDGQIGDDDLLANGQIEDQNGPGQPKPEDAEPTPVGGDIFLIDKLSILTPYLILAIGLLIATLILVKKRKH